MKKHISVYLALFIFCFSKNTNSQSILPILSKIYWNVNLKAFDKSMIDYYKENKNVIAYSLNDLLSKFNNAGYGAGENFYKFTFSNNPFFQIDSITGYVFISTKNTNSVENITSLKVCFGDFKQPRADSIFNKISNTFSKYSHSKMEKELKFGANRSDINYFNFNLISLNGFLMIKQVSYEKDFEISLELTRK